MSEMTERAVAEAEGRGDRAERGGARGAMWAVNAVTVVGAVVLLVMSLWPGYAGGCFYVLALPLVGALALAWLVVAGRMVGSRGRAERLPVRQVGFAPVVVCLTLALLVFYVPRRVAFAAVRGEFEGCLASAAPSTYGGARLDRRLGIYRVDEYAADPRGGVYFRTGSGGYGLGPDTMSYGFVYRPNPRGTPFGAAHYVVRPVGGGWYWFRVSNDWF